VSDSFEEALFIANESSVPNKGDEFVGYPHFFWAYPSKHLFEVKKEFDEKLLAGIKFVLQ
jgi:versiconal hemiacetal acetate esterase